MGGNLLFLWHLSWSEKCTWIIYYKSVHCSQCPLLRVENWVLVRSFPHSPVIPGAVPFSPKHVPRDPKVNLHRRSRWYVTTIEEFFIVSLRTIFSKTEHTLWGITKRGIQYFQSLWVRSRTVYQKNVQSLIRPNNGESSAGNGSKLDGLVFKNL